MNNSELDLIVLSERGDLSQCQAKLPDDSIFVQDS